METALQQTIQGYIDKNGLSVAGMERNAGLRVNVIRNVLRGQSKRPTTQTLQALAKLMGCEIQDLLSEDGDHSTSSIQMASETVIKKPEILKKVLDVALEVCDKTDITLTMKQLSSILDEVYSYTIKKSPPEVDADFVKWYISKIKV